MRRLLAKTGCAGALLPAALASPSRGVMLTGFASHRVPSGMAVLPVRDSEELLEEIAEAYVNMDLQTLAQFQQKATQKMSGEGKSLDFEAVLLQGMGGGGGGLAAAPTTSAAAGAGANDGAAAGAGEGGSDASAGSAKKAVEKQAFDVTLKKFPAENKIKLIKELRAICPMPIPEAKAAIERCPGVIVKNVSKADAEKLKTVLSGLGGEVDLV